ncbi:unnamed protein product [Urochloa humidicola]
MQLSHQPITTLIRHVLHDMRPSYRLRRPCRVGDRLLVIRSKRCMLLEKRNCSTQFHPRCLTKCSTSDMMFEVAEGNRRLTIAVKYII